jgi:hypothetical protein
MRMRLEVRRWRMHLRTDLDLEEIAKWAPPTLAGWVRYYGRFYPSKLGNLCRDALTVRRYPCIAVNHGFGMHLIYAPEICCVFNGIILERNS